jgi:hypothetical protein
MVVIDQYGEDWTIIERSGSLWATRPGMIRFILNDEIHTDLSEPRGIRNLKGGRKWTPLTPTR